jgi:LysM repeat protein
MLPGQENCPICGAERHVEATPPPIGLWALMAGVLSIVAFLGAVWFLRPWAEKAVATNVGPTATVTRTPSRRPTIVLPTPTATRTAAPTRTPSPLPTATPVPPTATATSVPEPSPQPAVHVVASGDNLGKIGLQYGVSAEAIAQANNITLKTMLSLGQKLIIPGVGGPAPTQTIPPGATTEPTQTPTSGPTQTPSAIHVIAKGDTLGAIAAKYNVSVETIARANNITPTTILRLGQELVIPGVEDPAAARVTPSPSARLSAATAVPAPSTLVATKPASMVHVVEAGDNLGSIAVKYNVDTETIAKANNITVRTMLQIGQELIIPGITLPTSTPTLEPTPTATYTRTATPAPTPTRMPTSNLPYQAPRLLAPINGSTVEGPSGGVLLNWTSVGILGEQEWYMVQIRRSEDDASPLVAYVKATSWRIGPETYPQEGTPHTFLWQVTVVAKSSEHEASVALSPRSDVYEFFWH